MSNNTSYAFRCVRKNVHMNECFEVDIVSDSTLYTLILPLKF